MSCNIFIETICQYITLIVIKLKNALKCLLLAHLFLFFTLTHLVGLFVGQYTIDVALCTILVPAN